MTSWLCGYCSRRAPVNEVNNPRNPDPQPLMSRDDTMMKTGFTQSPSGQVWDHKGKTDLVQIFISHSDDAINFLQFQYDENAHLVLSVPSLAMIVGTRFNTVKLNYPGEFLTSISGSYSDTNGYKVTSITFDTNLRRYGPFGQQRQCDREFIFQMGQDKQFGGFHFSTMNGHLESIGVYVKPITTPNKPA
ncbi:Inactive protein RESTRICTED TEV MOVEMENT 1 [Camellia lanceoleosa]|uniref:Inactive protein RESTRICTED TEV MOVEMENT 1 n=1 Tax=Camellia lanceoleosa TaxID=1840588 RepID=A0ACC0HC16_9ERIC|nr:Inactive protein RESTRICTED TEV MOVEMENT 1 [Camellia lanceoleosa]